jgi:hypothetical protein
MNKEYHNRQEVTMGDLGVIAGGIVRPASETTLDNALREGGL